MNRRHALFVLVALLAAIACPIRASEFGKELDEADARLNATYQRVLKGLPNDAARERLKAAQRAWVAWRDTEMAVSKSLYEDGKTDLFMQLTLTQKRIAQLEAIGKRDTEYGYEEKK
jgi:uncharacterized protein YecT (DUF1311 family)